MLLSDRDISHALKTGDLVVAPWLGGMQLQPASIEVHLDFDEDLYGQSPGWLILKPGEFRLAHTAEKVQIGSRLAARVEGKSSWGRLGLQIHCAGFIDPGFVGQITLELKNLHHQNSIMLRRGDPVGQMAILALSSPSDRPYGHPELRSHYQGQVGTTRSYMDTSAG